jgi:hypothetical protein
MRAGSVVKLCWPQLQQNGHAVVLCYITAFDHVHLTSGLNNQTPPDEVCGAHSCSYQPCLNNSCWELTPASRRGF